MFRMFTVLWGSILWERWVLLIVFLSLLMHYNLIAVAFNPLLWAVILIAVLVLIRIIAKGVWLNGDTE